MSSEKKNKCENACRNFIKKFFFSWKIIYMQIFFSFKNCEKLLLFYRTDHSL